MNTMNSKPIKVFLSYSRDDEHQAERLYSNLSSYGLDVWFDKESLLPGQTWEDEISQAIAESDFIILLLSSNSLGRRGYFHKELRQALDVLKTVPFGQVYVLPARINKCDIPAQLAPIHYVDLFPDWEHGIDKLLQAIELQSDVKSLALTIHEQDDQDASPTILLVNDEPSTMNFLVDVWRSSGVKVEYAFNVPQAINMIQSLSPSLVISDLSHFSSGRQMTKRAAFEILEWAQQNKQDIKVIVTTSIISKKRRKVAQELGAIGICNTLVELNNLIEESIGRKIDYPRDLVPSEFQDLGKTRVTRGSELPLVSCSVFISYARQDLEFVQKLSEDLSDFGVNAWFDYQTIRTGASWASPIEQMIETADVMLAIISRDSIENRWVQEEIYAGIARELNADTPFVIPVLIDEEPIVNMPFTLQSIQPFDFQKDYDEGLSNLLEFLRLRFAK